MFVQSLTGKANQMDKVSKIKNQFRAQQWAQIIRECRESGQTVTSWCASHGVGKKAYYYWLRKLRLVALEQSENLPCPADNHTSATTFKRLEVLSPVPDTKAAVIIRIKDATVEVNEGASQQTVQAVLLALHSIC